MYYAPSVYFTPSGLWFPFLFGKGRCPLLGIAPLRGFGFRFYSAKDDVLCLVLHPFGAIDFLIKQRTLSFAWYCALSGLLYNYPVISELIASADP